MPNPFPSSTSVSDNQMTIMNSGNEAVVSLLRELFSINCSHFYENVVDYNEIIMKHGDNENDRNFP